MNQLFPTIPTDDAASFEAPVREVTVLEDRAQVVRRGKQQLGRGRHRLVVWSLSPLLQNVSLRAEVDSGDADVIDVSVHRAYRVKREDKPEERRQLDEQIREMERAFGLLSDARERKSERYERLSEMVDQGLDEIPIDAAWGHVNPQLWKDTVEGLFQRSRELLEGIVEDRTQQRELLSDRKRLIQQREALGQVSHHFMACAVIDVEVQAEGEVELSLFYVVPNAMWRPLHSARLVGDALHLTSCATVWQNTGEDWEDAALSFSTARSSLGTEAPLLSDDLMQAQRKRDEIVVEQREVAIQTTGPEGGSDRPPPPQGIVLPGVDDGGDLLHLKAASPCHIPGDGQPHMIPLFSFQAPARTQRVCMPELQTKVFLKSTQTNLARSPLLAGPVELLQDHGLVGWTQLLFVAAQEAFDLNFGPDDGVRVSRTVERETEVDPIDDWKHTTTVVKLFLSNLEDADKKLVITERIPVSEVDYVKVSPVDEETMPHPTIDDNGLCAWQIILIPHETRTLTFTWKLSVAPDVQGL